LKITSRSSLGSVAAAISKALSSSGIRAILTGGGCATLHSGGEYQSEDLDWIVQSSPSTKELDAAMASVGFRREGDRYLHDLVEFFVEFPRGPLSIGRDLDISPVRVRIGKQTVLALSATDSCRDRLAAFYHWSDRQSLETAVAIALRKRVDLKKIREWSVGEQAIERFDEFAKELGAAKRSRRLRSR
jgi:hypothetical protein